MRRGRRDLSGAAGSGRHRHGAGGGHAEQLRRHPQRGGRAVAGSTKAVLANPVLERRASHAQAALRGQKSSAGEREWEVRSVPAAEDTGAAAACITAAAVVHSRSCGTTTAKHFPAVAAVAVARGWTLASHRGLLFAWWVYLFRRRSYRRSQTTVVVARGRNGLRWEWWWTQAWIQC